MKTAVTTSLGPSGRFGFKSPKPLGGLREPSLLLLGIACLCVTTRETLASPAPEESSMVDAETPPEKASPPTQEQHLQEGQGRGRLGPEAKAAKTGPGSEDDPIPTPQDITTTEARTFSPVQPAPPAFVEASSEASESLPVVGVRVAPSPSNRLAILGLMADVGVPDGLIGSVAVRPWTWVRVSGGGGTNTFSYGWRAGVTLLPFGSGPSASFEYGRYRDGDANALAKRFVGGGFNGSPALDRVGYEYMNAHLGLDFGFRNVVFFFHGGVTMVRGQIHNLGASIGGTSATGTTAVVVRQDPSFKAVGPSFKLGLLVYVW